KYLIGRRFDQTLGEARISPVLKPFGVSWQNVAMSLVSGLLMRSPGFDSPTAKYCILTVALLRLKMGLSVWLGYASSYGCRPDDTREANSMKTTPKLVIALAALLLLVQPLYAVTWTEIDFPGASTTAISGINTAGDMVGSYLNPGSFTIHGFADVA